MYQTGQDYAKAATNYGYQGQAQAGMNAIPAPPPRTISSAISRMEGLNERLGQVSSRLGGIADILGALRAVEACRTGEKPPESGVIHRLNDSADEAHGRLADIEDLLNAIFNALG